MTLARLLPRFWGLDRTLASLERHEHWSRAEIEAHQLERLNAVWREAIRTVPHYRDLAREQGLPTEFGSLQAYTDSVPILTKDDVRSLGHRLLSESPASGFWTRTGGSTGAPTRVYWSRGGHRKNLRVKYRFLRGWGIDPLAPHAFLWGHANILAPGLAGRIARFRMPLEDWFRGRLRLSAYHLDPEQLDADLDALERFRPEWLYAYSSAAYLLARRALETGRTVGGLRLVVMTSEPTFPHMVRTVEEAFGVPAVREYGSIECGYLALEAPDRTLKVQEDAVYLETVPCANGQYEMLMSHLGNPSFPLLRYAIGDVTPEPIDRSGPGFARLSTVEGRSHDMLITRTGGVLHSMWLEDVIEHYDAIRRMAAHQAGDGSTRVELELSGSPGSLETEALARRISDCLGGYPVTVEILDRIPTSPAGKHRWMTSELGAKLVDGPASTGAPVSGR